MIGEALALLKKLLKMLSWLDQHYMYHFGGYQQDIDDSWTDFHERIPQPFARRSIYWASRSAYVVPLEPLPEI
jgi:hypothetical protein